jgi:hypothetical protein
MCVDPNQEVVRRIGADRHEGPGTERDLAAVADQEIDAKRRQRQDQERNQDGAEEGIRRPGSGTPMKAKAMIARTSPAILGDREYLLVGPVGCLELAVFAVDHVVSPEFTRGR